MSTAATLLRAVAFTCVNEPPKYTVEPDTTSAFTVPLGAGSQPETRAAVDASTAAALFRVVPFTVVNEPPK